MSTFKGKWRPGKWRTNLAGGVLGAGLIGWLWWLGQLDNPNSVPAYITYQVWPWARWLIAAVLVVAGVAVLRWQLAKRSPAGLVARWSKRSGSGSGLAGWGQVMLHAGGLRLRWMAAVLRPHLRGESWRRRWTIPIEQLGYRLCRVGWLSAYSSVEEVTGRVAPPRSGKTAELANHIIDAPGGVIATSTKADIVELTAPLRLQRGKVHVFNPEQLGGPLMASTLRWNPVIGCENGDVAMRRAGYLLAGGPTMSDVSSREFWTSQAVRVLGRVMHAAALHGGTMLDVANWLSDPKASAGLVLKLLRKSPAGRSWGDDYSQFLNAATNTSTSITTSIMPSLQWVMNSQVAASTMCGRDEQFDVERLIKENGTLYLLGEDKPHGTLAPLITTFVAYVHEEAKRLAGVSPAGRLDPPLTMALDEVALLCPVPLDRWSADSGGRGIVLHWAAQSRAQLAQKWGENGAKIIWGNTTAKLIFGGCDDENDLAAYSALIGDRTERVPRYDENNKVVGHDTRRVPALTPAQIRTLPQWHVVMIKRGMPAALGVVRPVWRRRDVRRAARRGTFTPAATLPVAKPQRAEAGE